jgi:adenylate kinase family enzyme
VIEQPEQRIAVIGCPGAGKSTLATLIARATDLPLIHLDAEHWQPGWVEPEREAWLARAAALADGPHWVIDGMYNSTLPARLRRPTLVVYLDLPTATCLWGAMKRVRRWRGRSRPDMTEGCPEKLDAEFVAYILTFRRRIRPLVERLLAGSDVRVIRLTSTRDRARFTAALTHGELAAGVA